ncbi:hypothetical protein B0J14DRAFT_601128 [Halenospora varia]|nr:hypothetical protein B0J14DRAFT_601128 [Halenospora varia]
MSNCSLIWLKLSLLCRLLPLPSRSAIALTRQLKRQHFMHPPNLLHPRCCHTSFNKQPVLLPHFCPLPTRSYFCYHTSFNEQPVLLPHFCILPTMVDDWLYRLRKYNTNGIEKLAAKYRNGDKCICVKMNNGSFNWCFKVVFDDGTEWAVRFPVAGNVMYPEEKVRREVAVMRFMKERTTIPVPEVIAFGMAADNHDPEMGPFIIEEWIDGVTLSTIMEELPRPSWGPVLRKDISDETLYTIYRQERR